MKDLGSKKALFFKKLSNKYRFAIFNEQTYEEIFAIRLSRLNVFTVVGTFGTIIVILVIMLIAFTGLREYIPGYPDANQRLMIVRNAQRVDSLIIEIEKRNQFIHTMQTILGGGELPSDVSPYDEPAQSIPKEAYPELFARSAEDSVFRSFVEREVRFNVLGYSPPDVRTPLDDTFFFTPLRGLVVNGFGETTGHFGVDVVAAPGSRVSSIMEGMVIFSGWTVETGFVIQVQHPNNLVSIYKHNEILLKDVGQRVKAGEAIARLGNSGELTTGPHLHFEMWHNGMPINPVDYISF